MLMPGLHIKCIRVQHSPLLPGIVHVEPIKREETCTAAKVTEYIQPGSEICSAA